MAPTCPARQTAGRESPQDWLGILDIDLATFCDMWSRKQPELMSFDHINFLESEGPATSWLPTTPTLHPYRTACVPCKINYLIWWAFQLAIHGIDYLVK